MYLVFLFLVLVLALLLRVVARNPQRGGRMMLASKHVTNKCCLKKHCPVGWFCSEGRCKKVSVGTPLAKHSSGDAHNFCYNDTDCKAGNHCGYNSECVKSCKKNDDCRSLNPRMRCVNMGQGRLECRMPCQGQRECTALRKPGVQVCKKKKRTTKAIGHCIGVFPNIHREGKHTEGCKNTGLAYSLGKFGPYFTSADKCKNGSKALFTKRCFYPLKVSAEFL